MQPAQTVLFRALGTMNRIDLFSAPNPAANEALRAVETRVLELHARLSVFEPESELSRLNDAAGRASVPVSADTLALLLAGKRYSTLSQGAFSMTTRPLSGLWQTYAQSGGVPSRAEIEPLRALVDDADVLLDEAAQTAMLRRLGQSVDFGGIAKGYAANEARRILVDAGVTNALINFGGTVVALGGSRAIGVQHPDRETGLAMGKLVLQDSAVVTSGDYERGYTAGGVRYHHILDPRTGYPARSNLRSVTLVGDSALELDALSTAVFVLGAEAGLPLIRACGAEAVFITNALDVFCTEGLKERFSLIPPSGFQATSQNINLQKRT